MTLGNPSSGIVVRNPETAITTTGRWSMAQQTKAAARGSPDTGKDGDISVPVTEGQHLGTKPQPQRDRQLQIRPPLMRSCPSDPEEEEVEEEVEEEGVPMRALDSAQEGRRCSGSSGRSTRGQRSAACSPATNDDV
ncbi:hypothetical protein GBF38_008583 [Nibea albiflora]|uniref:Uncharacterized protein n=1 Tax=Nibea albiflora TaxID=240163 RepID=A0ACB7EQC2_NIBAL|nr:hypothetical protein GBF38_008583 [Nibea albiflora]